MGVEALAHRVEFEPPAPRVLPQAPRLAFRDLKVSFAAERGLVPVVHGVSFDVLPGGTLGLVGESGCGKSVTCMAALGLLGPRAVVSGSATLDGRELIGASTAELDRVRGGRIAMIFQDPMSSLNPVHSVGRQIRESLSLHRGLEGRAAEAEAKRLLDRVGIPSAGQRMKEYPHQLSGGMNQRAMIAIALAGEPDVLIADEPTTALDVTIQAQILDLLADIRAETGMAIVLISHDLGVIAETCDDVAVMYCGRIVERAPVETLFAGPRHPYTIGLLHSLPRLETQIGALEPIAGVVPEPWAAPAGCAFAPRCSGASALCHAKAPQLARSGGRSVACHHPQIRFA
ncbi:ABC transporter ATP-binding protein [Desertibaculum subflavum]|uniref:ABC transporter ATP-binding protein n=1 Tax=Desertibaculum subflavum TaxID=2268458 RepID=UPI000E6639CE